MASWSLCIATLNRHEVLMTCLAHAAGQTRPPAEIVVVDASETWAESREAAQALLQNHPGIRLDYIESPVKSSSEQRNIALRAATGDVVFLIDDDSFMHPDCAAEILRVYESGAGTEVSAVAALNVPELPPAPGAKAATPDLQRKSSGRGQDGFRRMVLRSSAGRWVNRKILLQNTDELFLKYDEPRDALVPKALAEFGAYRVSVIGGCVMTVRRHVALAEPFDPALRYYAAFEDLDVSYRYGRHGLLLCAPRARLHHFEVAGGRVKRRKIIAFQLLNTAVFLKRHASPPERFYGRYRMMLWRRLLGEALKDLLSGRWSLPQARGVVIAMRHWRAVRDCDPAMLDTWYPPFQKRILKMLD